MNDRSLIRVPVVKIQRFCTHDGPGVRTTVFFKGCPLKCVWCHNPEARSFEKQFFLNSMLCTGCGACARVCPVGSHEISEGVHTVDRGKCVRCMKCVGVCVSGGVEACSSEMTLSDIIRTVLSDRAFYDKNGGLTVSGGEPTAHPEALVGLLSAVKAEGIHTAIETCGYFPRELASRLLPLTDLFLWDFKDGDNARHLLNTGVENLRIIENLRYIDGSGGRTRLRCIIVREVNDNDSSYSVLAEVYGGLKNCEGAELIPYHAYGNSKYGQLGLESTGGADWMPDKRDISAAAARLKAMGVKILNR